MAKRRGYASLHAGMIKTVQPKRAVYLTPDENGNLVRAEGWAIIPVKAA